MRCQTFDAPLGAKPVMTLLGSVQTTTLVVVMIEEQYMITLRKATEEELPQIHNIQIMGFAPVLEKYRDYETNPGAEEFEKVRLRFGQSFTDYYFICRNELPVGMLRVCNFGEKCRISPICIIPEFRGKGYGQAALRLVEDHYPDARCWELDTILQEDKLCRLYEKLGYYRTGKYETIRDGMDLVYYKKVR